MSNYKIFKYVRNGGISDENLFSDRYKPGD
jgi:hypothetical protein